GELLQLLLQVLELLVEEGALLGVQRALQGLPHLLQLPLGLLVGAELLHDRAQPAVLARDLPVLRRVVDDGGIAQLVGQVLVPLNDAFQLLFHAGVHVHSPRQSVLRAWKKGAGGPVPRVARRQPGSPWPRAVSKEAIATSIWLSSGPRVVRHCSHMPGTPMALTNALP